MTKLTRATITLFLLVSAACGGGDGGAPGVNGAKQISAVTEAEKASLCDWFAEKLGGYGAPSTCAEGFVEAPPTKAECTSDFPSCAVTVSQFQDCMDLIVASQKTCTQQSLSAAQMNPTCQAIASAGCFN